MAELDILTRRMGEKQQVFLTVSLLFLCLFTMPSYSAPFCFERFGCSINNGGRRLPYYPPPPIGNKQIRQDDPRAPPVRDLSAPPSPSTIL